MSDSPGNPMTDVVTPPVPAFDRARDLPRLDLVAQDLAAVEAALTRLDDGTYGRCSACEEQIADARLADWPATDSCGAHDF